MHALQQLHSAVSSTVTSQLHITPSGLSAGTAQAQVADIGLMGCPAKKDGKAVEGVRIFLGGTIGENAALASEFEKVPPHPLTCHDSPQPLLRAALTRSNAVTQICICNMFPHFYWSFPPLAM